MKLNKKNRVLLLGFCIVLYICYAFAFSNTWEYYDQYTTQRELTNTSLNDPAYLQSLLQKEKQLDKVLSQYSNTTNASFQNELLRQLSILSSRDMLKIVDFKEPHTFVEKNIRTNSYVFSLQGSFNGILLLINSLENNPSLGYIKNITFTKKKNYRTGEDYLAAEVILQKSETVKERDNDEDKKLQ